MNTETIWLIMVIVVGFLIYKILENIGELNL